MNGNRAILRWLADTLGAYLEVPATSISPTVPLAEIGVDSVHAVSLAGEIEAKYDIDVEPTLIFDYPTLAQIAEFISTTAAEHEPAS
jgi:acyl carrier protein